MNPTNIGSETLLQISQEVGSAMFTLYRKTIRLRELVEGSSRSRDESEVVSRIDALTKMIDTFYAVHGDWLDQCIANFPDLSTQLMQSAGTMMFNPVYSLMLTVGSPY